MYKYVKVLSVFIFVGLLMAGCGNSGNETPSAGAGPGGGTVVGGGPGGGGGGTGTPSNAFLFFKSGSISAVDPANPTATPVVVEPAGTSGETGVMHATLDLTNKQMTGMQTRTIIYANTGDGKLYKISALKSEAQTPVQVSNETGGSEICDTEDGEPDLADHGNSLYFYELPGPDGDCFQSVDNILKMVRLNMGAADSPVTITPKRWESVILNNSSGAIVGHLAFDENDLVRCDQNFENCVDVISFGASAEEMWSNFANDAILRVDDKLFHYNYTTGVLSPTVLHTFAGGTPSDVIHHGSETTLYFADGDTFFTLPMNGSLAATPMATESGRTFSQITLTKNKVVYRADASGISVVKAVGLLGGTPATLLGPTSDGLEVFEFIVSDWVFYTRFSPTGMGRGLIKDDGTGGAEVADATWSGFAGSTFSSSGFVSAKVISIEGCPSFNCGGGTVKSMDAATGGGELTLGTLPSDISFVSVFGLGGGLLGRGLDAGSASDILFMNTDQANSLTRVTTTPGFDEFPISF